MGNFEDAVIAVLGEDKGKPLSSYILTYDAPTSQLEPVYFWLLDFIQNKHQYPMVVEKITDNFMSSPGSGHFAEMNQRATRMQEEGMKILGLINQVIKTILNLIYDLKEFKLRLSNYEDAKSDDKEQAEAGMLALKQIWLDQVDLKRGRGSIHQMSYEMGFTTLRESFMIANSLDDVKDNEVINESIKRILLPRVAEFLKWKDYSEKELKKRFNIEKSYLKTEVESLKLYTSWARPYLKAAEELRQKGFDKNPALVNAFNTALFELAILGKSKVKELPYGIKGGEYKPKRDYYSCVLITLKFRGLPQKVTQQHYGFGGRVEIEFKSYALNDDEINLIQEQLKKKDIEDGLKMVTDNTETSLNELKDDLNELLEEKDKEEEEKKKESDDINPFSALFGLFKSSKKDDKKDKDKNKIKDIKDVRKDNYVEEGVRELAADSAKKSLYTVYDIYKKAHGMASSPDKFDN